MELRPPAELQTLPKLTGKELVEKLRQIMSMPRTTEHEREPSSKGAVAGPPPAPARGVPSAQVITASKQASSRFLGTRSFLFANHREHSPTQDVVTHWLLAAKKVPRPPAKLLPWASKRASARVIEASSEARPAHVTDPLCLAAPMDLMHRIYAHATCNLQQSIHRQRTQGDFYWEEPSWKGSSDLTPEQRQMQLEKGAVTFGRGVGRFTVSGGSHG